MDYSHALKHAMDLATMLKTSQTINVLRTWKLLTRKLHSKLPSVQWSVYNNWFSFLFSTWISTRTPMKTSTTPENARFSGGWKEASFFFFFSGGRGRRGCWLVWFSPTSILRSFIMLLDKHFFISLLLFTVLAPKYPLPIYSTTSAANPLTSHLLGYLMCQFLCRPWSSNSQGHSYQKCRYKH